MVETDFPAGITVLVKVFPFSPCKHIHSALGNGAELHLLGTTVTDSSPARGLVLGANFIATLTRGLRVYMSGEFGPDEKASVCMCSSVCLYQCVCVQQMFVSLVSISV